EEQFRKANGLWSQNSISMRKWVALPVDACEVKGRSCAAPTDAADTPDLAPTPETEEDDYGWQKTETTSQQHAEDIFGPPRANGSAAPEETKPEDSGQPWTHVRWVSIDTFTEPVQIGRISKRAFGYFRPRRKKSLLSTMSRPSLDAQSSTQVSAEGGGDDRGGPSSRRQSLLSNRPPNLAVGSAGFSTPVSTRSRMGSAGADARPAWMRQPGGVGSLNRSVRAPGPEKDPLNSWAKKHFPALVVDSLPDMSVTDTEAAQLGLSTDGGPIAGGAEDLSKQGNGLDRAAAAVETWLRGALAKRPGTPTRGEWTEEGGDLIELTDTQSDDSGRPAGRGADLSSSLGSLFVAATGGKSGEGRDASVSRRGKNKDD
ncbi:hypothetical protein IMZ48_14360, partial [Candidatus Bathyarchaeota archaeon]|nr:hypothetical protein [Candidatus Bathyarchaeota archaeon]